MQMSEKHRILPANHFGCRAGRSTSDSLHYVTKAAKDAMAKDKVVSVLFLDIKGAFLASTSNVSSMTCETGSTKGVHRLDYTQDWWQRTTMVFRWI